MTSSPETVVVTAYVKATQTAVHDLCLSLSLPASVACDRAALRRHFEDLHPGVLTAACSEATVDRITDVAVLDVIEVSWENTTMTAGPDAGKGPASA